MIRLLLTLLLVTATTSCGTETRNLRSEQRLSSGQLDRLQNKVSTYLDLLDTVDDEHGFVETSHCDSLLFSGLTGTVWPTDLTAARRADGRWFRRPTRDCYPKYSASSISRDMLLGVMWWALVRADLDTLEKLWAYGERENWVMGEGPLSRTLMTPGLISTLALLVEGLGGEDHYVAKSIPAVWGETVGFQAHLQVLHLLLREKYGEGDLQVVREHAERQPLNALFQFAARRYTTAYLLLMNEDYWPGDRLPTSGDRCSPWILERNYGEDWTPCPEEGRTHSGGDYLFTAGLLLRSHGR